MKTKDYRKEREYYNLLKSKRRDDAFVKSQIADIYNVLLLNLDREIRSQVFNFSNSEGISIQEARKRISKADMDYYKDLAKRYVAEKDFSDKDNHEMKLYNVTMRLNRLEFLSAVLRAHIIATGSRLENAIGDHLLKGSIDEYKRQAGLLGFSLSDKDIVKRAEFIVGQDYYNAHFSDRIWRDTKELSRRIARNIDSVVIQGNNPQVFARKLRDLVKGDIKNARSATERLAFTESGRVWIETQIDAYKEGGYKYLEVLTEPTACKECSPHNGDIVRIDEAVEGDNIPLWHPRCRCTTVAYEVEDKISRDMSHNTDYNNGSFIEIKESFINSKSHRGRKVENLPKEKYDFINYESGYKLVYDHKRYEKDVAQWLSDNVGGNVFLCPRIEFPKGKRTPDYIWDNEKRDLKNINKHSKNTINTAIKNTKNQSNNVVLNLIDSTYSDEDLNNEMIRIFSNPRYKYIDKILVLENSRLRKIYKRA